MAIDNMPNKSKNVNNKVINNLLPQKDGFEVGGIKKQCDVLNKNIGHIVEHISQDVGKDMVNLQSELINPYGQNPFCIDLSKISNLDQLIIKIRQYAENQTDLSSTTIERDIRRIKLMADKNQMFPIDFLNPSVEQWNYHMAWYKENKYNENNNDNYYGLKERREAFYLYLDAVNIPKLFFPYKLPKKLDGGVIEFPNPDIAYKMTKYNYFDNKELNYYFQFAHLYNFIVGPRAPSEMALMKINNIDWDSNTIEFKQPKLHNKARKIMLPEVFVKGKTRKSLKNYVDYHRNDYIDKRYSEDYLFISPYSGKPFWHENNKRIAVSRSANLGKMLNQTGKKVFPKYYPYMGRHFCATGTLINRYRSKHHDPIESTRNFMGHSKTHTTRGYTALAEQYYQRYSFDWFKHILKGSIFNRGKYAKNQNKLKKPLFRMELLREKNNSPVQGHYLVIEGKSIKTKPIFNGFENLSISLKPFFSFFNNLKSLFLELFNHRLLAYRIEITGSRYALR